MKWVDLYLFNARRRVMKLKQWSLLLVSALGIAIIPVRVHRFWRFHTLRMGVTT